MNQTTTLRTLLQPELEAEFAKTAKVLDHLPDGKGEYKPAEKSMSLASLAGHVAQMPDFITLILNSPDIDLAAAGFQPLLYTTRAQVLAEFNHRADLALTAFKNASDETLDQPWALTFKGHKIFSGTRYEAYREMGLDHMIHHRGQLTVYLRMLGAVVPGTFGPSADEAMGGQS